MGTNSDGQSFITKSSRKAMKQPKQLSEGTNSELWNWDLQSNRALITKEWSNLLGFPETEIIDYGDKWRELIHHDDIGKIWAYFHRCIEERLELYQCEYRIRLRNKQYKWISSSGRIIWDKQGKAVRMEGIHTDISARIKMEKKLEELSCYDQLTGAYIRGAFINKLTAAIQKAEKNNMVLAVLFIDVDDIKMINDIYGRDIGDIYLKKLVRRIKTCMKENDSLGRFGGDEFAMFIMGDRESSFMSERAEQVLKLVNQPLGIMSYRIYSSISIGIANYPADGNKPNVLINKADIAKCMAKERGKNRYLDYKDDMVKDKKIILDIKRGILKAINEGEFHLCYQPILDLQSNNVVSAEALIRWRHPDLGLIGPKDFIPAAEETKLIIPLGNWVLKEACRQAREWLDMGYNYTVAVNVSALQLHQPDFPSIVSRLLKKYRLTSERIELEMTEGLFIGYDQTVDNNMKSLSMMGISLAIDDFGTGYNSFQCIQNPFFNRIKIDRNFIMDIENDTNKSIVNSIINLGHRVNMVITAEGVENKEQYEYLKKVGCDSIQGYFISEPHLPKKFIDCLTDLSFL